VDLDDGWPTVRQQVVQLGRGTDEDKPKSDASDREVALPRSITIGADEDASAPREPHHRRHAGDRASYFDLKK
jgi:hypothetical protein